MTYVDSAVLDLTEQMCRRLQAWTGRTNVWLAFQLTNLSIVVYFIWAAGLYFVSGDLALRIFVALFCGGVFFVLTRTIFKVSIEGLEIAAYRPVAKGRRNPRRIRDAQLRIAFLTLSVVLPYPLWFAYITLHLRFVLLTEALIILTTVVLYVLACDPLPPCAGKVKEWFRWMARARTEPVSNRPYARESSLAAFEGFELFEGARPVRSQQTRQAPIRKDLSTGLAPSAVVRFVVRVANAQNLVATPGARLAIASMDRHTFAKCGDLFWKTSLRLGSQAVHPELERFARGNEQPVPLVRL